MTPLQRAISFLDTIVVILAFGMAAVLIVQDADLLAMSASFVTGSFIGMSLVVVDAVLEGRGRA